MSRKLQITAAVTIVAGYLGIRHILKKRKLKGLAEIYNRPPPSDWKMPPRYQMLQNLKKENFDLLIIGGGATGSGCALDAATRGLNVALVEANDFSSETSSRSTKLLHGGVRYLELAFKSLDWKQLFLVNEALQERKTAMEISPHLTKRLPIILPIYSILMVPYYWFGLRLYEWFSFNKSLGKSYFISRKEVIEKFPKVRQKSLCGGMVYYDAQQDDAKNNVMLAMTAAYHGGTVVNYAEVKELLEEDGKVAGALILDKIRNKTFEVKAKGVINATGPFTDKIRQKGTKSVSDIMVYRSGTHIVLPDKYCPKNMGLLDPDTSDGRVMFFIPWKGKAVIGATDNSCKLESRPLPSNEDISFLLKETNSYMNDNVSRKEILSAWTGIRPLVMEPGAKDTKSIVREHTIEIGENNLITVTGGKWTTYRKMAEDAIDTAMRVCKLKMKRPCITKYIKVIGSHEYTNKTYKEIQRRLGVSETVARHLAETYGDRACHMQEYMQKYPGYISSKYPYLNAEIPYSIENEMACKMSDFLCNRLRIGFIDVREAKEMMGTVGKYFRSLLGWSYKKYGDEERSCIDVLKTLGYTTKQQA